MRKRKLVTSIIFFISISFSVISFANLDNYRKNIQNIYTGLHLNDKNKVIAYINDLTQYPFKEVEEGICKILNEEIYILKSNPQERLNYKLFKTILLSLKQIGTNEKISRFPYNINHNVLKSSAEILSENVFYINNLPEDLITLSRETVLAIKDRNTINPSLKNIDLNLEQKNISIETDDTDGRLKESKLQNNIEIEKDFLSKAKKELNEQVIGQQEAKDKILNILLRDQIFSKNTRPNILYLMGAPGTGKDTIAKAFASVLELKDHVNLNNSDENILTLGPLAKDADTWKVLGSNSGHVGSEHFPKLLDFLITYSGGRYQKIEIKKGTNQFKIMENPLWEGEYIKGYKTPSEGVLFIDEFHNWSKEAKDTILKRAMQDGTFSINDPKGGLISIQVPINIVIASNEGINLVSSREVSGVRFGRPLSYKESFSLWEKNNKDKSLLKDTILNHYNRIDGGLDAKGISEEMLNRVPLDNFILLKPLSPKELRKIVIISLNKLKYELLNNSSKYKKINLSWDNKLVKFIQNFQYSSEDNARPMQAKVLSLIETTFLDAILQGKIEANKELKIDLSIKKNKNGSAKLLFSIQDKSNSKDATINSFALNIKATKNNVLKKPLSQKKIEHLLTMASRMKEKVFGASEVIDRLAEAVLLSEEGAQSINRIDDATEPARSFMFLGPSSTGKTELAKVLTEELVGDRNKLVVMDFSQVTSIEDIKTKVLGKKDSLGRPIASRFMKEYDRKNGKFVVVFDEIANTRKEFLKSLYDILREPIVSTFSDGKERVMSNVTIIMTGNTGEEWYNGLKNMPLKLQRQAREDIYKQMNKSTAVRRKTLEQHFSEAFLNRVGEDNIFFFPSLNYKSSRQLLNAKIAAAIKSLEPSKSKIGWHVSFESLDEYKYILKQVEQDAFSIEEQGASLDRFAKEYFSKQIKLALLKNKVPSKTKIVISFLGQTKQYNVLSINIKNKDKPIIITIPHKEYIKTPERKVDRFLVALHEAGHAITEQSLSKHLARNIMISILPGITNISNQFIPYQGIAASNPILDVPMTKDLLLSKIAKLAGGFTAQKLMTKNQTIDAGKSNDMQIAYQIAENYILRSGLSEQWGDFLAPSNISISEFKQGLSESRKILLEKEINKLLIAGSKLAQEALLYNYKTLIKLGTLLFKQGELDQSMLQNFFNNNKVISIEEILEKQEQGSKHALSFEAQEALKIINKQKFKTSKKFAQYAELKDSIKLPLEMADIDQIVQDRIQKEISLVDNYDKIPVSEDNTGFVFLKQVRKDIKIPFSQDENCQDLINLIF